MHDSEWFFIYRILRQCQLGEGVGVNDIKRNKLQTSVKSLTNLWKKTWVSEHIDHLSYVLGKCFVMCTMVHLTVQVLHSFTMRTAIFYLDAGPYCEDVIHPGV